jgi:hypothetical protein
MATQENHPGGELHMPEFNTVEEFINGAEAADAKLHDEITTILGNAAAHETARGRVQMVIDAMDADPDGNFYTGLPLASLRTDKMDRILPEAERARAMAVNEAVLEQLYEEAEVDYRKRKLEDSSYKGHAEREIVYPTDKGIRFEERWRYDYGDDPNRALPIGLEVTVHGSHSGQVGDERFVSPPAAETQS